LLARAGSVSGADDVWTWERCLTAARARQAPELAAARYALRAAEARLDSEGAEFRPQVSLETGAGVVSDASESDSAGPAAGAIVSLTGRMQLYPGRDGRGLKQIEEAAVAAVRAEAAAGWCEFRFKLRQAFIDSLYAQELIPLLEANSRRRDAVYRVMAARHASGQESQSAVLVGWTLVFESRAEVSDAKANLALSYSRLGRLMGMELPAGFCTTGRLDAAVPAPTNNYDQLACVSPEYRVAECAVRRAEGLVAAARSRHGPQLSAVANMSPRSDSWAQDSPEWFAGVRLVVPLYAGGRRESDVAAAEYERRRAAAMLLAVKRDIATAMESAAAEWRAAVGWMWVAREGLEASEALADLARREAESGLALLARWEEAERDLARRRQAGLKTRRDAARAFARWERLTGGGERWKDEGSGE
jgi:outer membrane protein TolC